MPWGEGTLPISFYGDAEELQLTLPGITDEVYSIPAHGLARPMPIPPSAKCWVSSARWRTLICSRRRPPETRPCLLICRISSEPSATA